jgi:hypothetical protein
MLLLDLTHFLFVGFLAVHYFVLFVDVHLFCSLESLNEVVLELKERVLDVILDIFELV